VTGPHGLAELRGEGWGRLLAAARRRLERTGGSLEGAIGLSSPTDAERRTVIGITGAYRAEGVKRLAVELRDLDRALRTGYGAGLIELLADLGGPLRDRRAERANEQQHREDARRAAAESVLAQEPWFAEWLDALASDGTVTRLVRRDEAALLESAVRILERLHGGGTPARPLPLTVLAEWATGDTKALLPGTPLSTLVLRALALRSGSDGVPHDRTGQRLLWESAGAIGDDLASQVLVLGLRCRPGAAVSSWLGEAARLGLPFRLTLNQLTADPVVPDARDLFVCENPAVLRVAAAELAQRCPPLVCTEGVPSAACHKLLAAAVGAGARLRWRADFDWTGLRIVGAAIAAHGAHPWRMSADDYRRGLSEGDSTPLTGPPAQSPWDPRLATLIAAEGRTVMEERLITTLLEDLSDAEHADPARACEP
jgi:uncharacterized protein (TIGR02679 family)